MSRASAAMANALHSDGTRGMRMVLGGWIRGRRFWPPPHLDALCQKEHISRTNPEVSAECVGHALREVQDGGFPPEAKPLRGELTGIHELRVVDAAGTYRAVYVARFESFIYVLHVFQKKSTHGHSMSRRDVDRIRQRLARAEAEEAVHLRDQGDRT